MTRYNVRPLVAAFALSGGFGTRYIARPLVATFPLSGGFGTLGSIGGLLVRGRFLFLMGEVPPLRCWTRLGPDMNPLGHLFLLGSEDLWRRPHFLWH